MIEKSLGSTSRSAADPVKREMGYVEVSKEFTASEYKRKLYEVDPYFADGKFDADDLYGENLVSALARGAGVLLKPEAIVQRKCNEIIAFIVESGFQIAAARELNLTRHIVRELWRYQINAYPRERRGYLDLWHGTAPCIFLLLRDVSEHSTDACERITRLKGASNPKLTAEGTLRRRLNHSIDMINYVHSTDDIADFVRDIGILFEQHERAALLTALRSKVAIDPRPLVADVEARYVNEHPEVDRTIWKLVSYLQDRSPGIKDLAIAALSESSDQYWARRKFLRTVIGVISADDRPITLWESLYIIAYCSPASEEGRVGMIPSYLQQESGR